MRWGFQMFSHNFTVISICFEKHIHVRLFVTFFVVFIIVYYYYYIFFLLLLSSSL